MTSPADRPAAELLGELGDMTAENDYDSITLSVGEYRELLARLWRFEQWPGSREGLARLMFDNDYQLYSSDEREHMWKRARQSFYYRHADAIIAALRASQGDSNG